MRFKFYKQLNRMDCGPACLRMIARCYGKSINADNIRQDMGFNKGGVSMLGIGEAAERMGFRTRAVRITYDMLTREALLPSILHWNQSHFVILLPISRWSNRKKVRIADPAREIVELTRSEFEKKWLSTVNSDGERVGLALLIEPTLAFYEQSSEKSEKLSWSMVLQYFRMSQGRLVMVFIALLVSSGLQLIFPFLTQSIVDTGINSRNIQFVMVVLIAQLMLIFSKTIVDFIRSRLLMEVSVMVNLSILSDFWIKILKLPLSHFQVHHTGDTLQRLSDNKLIQNFLTGTTISTLFSVLNFFVYAVVLVFYNVNIFLVFSAGSVLYLLWILLFMRVRRKINYEVFSMSALENNATLQLVQGIQEIRLNSAEQVKRWEWENVQAKIFKLNFKSLNYNQFQQAGAMLISQGKDAAVTFLVAKMVIDGQLTLGAMLAVQYMIGQLSGPIEQFISFMQNAQDARISMERLNEIHGLENEESADTVYIKQLSEDKSIRISNFSFTYPGAGNEPVLKGLDLVIPHGKVTAIVGMSGSGKTTLLKILTKIYSKYEGDIKVGNTNFKYVSPSFWRKQCGVVMQDGFIFNDPIAKNISVAEESPDYERLLEACRIANILSFIETLPNGLYTKLGALGTGISQGQKQRLLIARAVYKDPQYLFFDEATNALDANNERAIVENLQEFFKGRTVVVIAHRLSTVKNADKIIVLDNGKIVEEGTHYQLTQNKGQYFQLVKNQLEMGN